MKRSWFSRQFWIPGGLLAFALGLSPIYADDPFPSILPAQAQPVDLPPPFEGEPVGQTLKEEAGEQVAPPATGGATPLASIAGAPAGCDGCCGYDFKKVPPVRIFPRPGFFTVPPKGEGYYSTLDWLTGTWRKGPPKYGYPPFGLMPPSFFDADFRYLDDPKNKDHDWADPLHRVHVGENWLFSTGGQVWWRYMNEQSSRLTGRQNVYDLFRARAYTDLWYQDKFRVYAEFITAQTFNQDLAPLLIDRNYADFLNLFVDVKIGGDCDHPAYLRVGRQELLLGSQRLISTLDWANTRRTFQGARAFRQGEKWDVDLFWVQPVIPNATRLDSVDNNQNFAGLWVTHRPQKGQFLDLYYLFLDNTNRTVQQGIQVAPYNVHTAGFRYAGDKNHFLWDVENMIQLGERGSQDILAGNMTVGGGYHFECAPLNPVFWVYYDYASGDRNPNAGSSGTFNQLFPFGHYYMGWGDWVGRQNIQDLNAHLYLYPAKWVTLWLQYHHFWLAQSRDALYNVAGNAYRRSANGSAGRDVGNELDIVTNFHLTKHSDLLIGYSYLWAGRFIQQTGPGQDPSLFYVQYQYRW